MELLQDLSNIQLFFAVMVGILAGALGLWLLRRLIGFLLVLATVIILVLGGFAWIDYPKFKGVMDSAGLGPMLEQAEQYISSLNAKE